MAVLLSVVEISAGASGAVGRRLEGRGCTSAAAPPYQAARCSVFLSAGGLGRGGGSRHRRETAQQGGSYILETFSCGKVGVASNLIRRRGWGLVFVVTYPLV